MEITVKPFVGHGYSNKEFGLYIGRIPGRKRIALYSNYKAEVTPLAYFTSGQKAEEALKYLDIIAKAYVRDELLDGPIERI